MAAVVAQRPGPGLSRRRFFGLAGAGAPPGRWPAGAAGGVIGRATADEVARRPTRPPAPIPFDGTHQAGIVTPAQDRLHFVAFDVITDDRDELAEVLRAWTVAARRMTAGQDAGEVETRSGGGQYAVPDDTGEAIGLPPSGLTLTVGFGPTLFTAADGTDRFGLAARRPAPLARLPSFGDALDPAISGGDLCVQACANDPAGRGARRPGLIRLGAGVVGVRWSQLGFGRTIPPARRPRRGTCSASRTAPTTSRARTDRPSTASSGSATTTQAPTGWPAGRTW